MTCYVDNKPCTCTIDQMAEGCSKDTGWIDDPFRGSPLLCEERDHLLYLNGAAVAARPVYG